MSENSLTAPGFAVVLATRNRPMDVARAVGSILASDYPHFTVIVVDQSDDERTLTALEPWGGDRRLRVVTMKRAGLAAARNLGCKESQAGLIAFTDDDCEVSEHWLSALSDAFAADSRVAMVFGSVQAVPYDLGSGFIPSYRVRSLRVVRHIRNKPKAEGIGACMAVRRDALTVLGGFDECLGAGAPFHSGEDADLTVRALLAGYSVCETPSAVVSHHGFRSWSEGAPLIAGYMYGLGAVSAKSLRLAKLRAIAPLAALGWRWLAGRPVADLNHIPPRGMRLSAFLRGFGAGLRVPLAAGSGRFSFAAREYERVQDGCAGD